MELVQWMEGGRTMKKSICGKGEFWAWSRREKEYR